MPVYISEIVTEAVIARQPDEASAAAPSGEPDVDLIVRRAVERVLEILRREWDR